MVGSTLAQTPMPRPPEAANINLQQERLTGWVNVVYGDPQAGSGLPPQHQTILTDGQGTVLATLSMDKRTAERFNGQEVEIIGRRTPQPDALAELLVESIELATDQAIMPEASAVPLTGSQAWVNILCRFADINTTPHDPSWYPALFGNSYPGLDHYWQQISYNNINLNGTTTTTRWYRLPKARSAYFTTNGDANLGLLVTDCTAAANADVFYPQYVGINMMFNESLDCCAWGGGWTLALDGQSKFYRTTWLPPWGQDHATIAHEMGHGFGLPHSTGPWDNPPSDLSIYVSQWDVMSASWSTCQVFDPEFGCIAQGTIAFHLDLDKWIPESRRVNVYPGGNQSITLERLNQPNNNSNALVARIPINGSGVRFYTVEVRDGTGYDQNIPSVNYIPPIPNNATVLIHNVDTTRGGNGGYAYVVDALEDLNPQGCAIFLPLPVGCDDLNDDVNDLGAMWLEGETFFDSENDITVNVLSAAGSTFTVQIINNSPPQAFPDAPSDLTVINTTLSSISIGWRDNSFNEDGFKIYRWDDCGGGNWDFCPYATVGADVTTFTDTPLSCGQQQWYEVSSYNANAESEQTFWVSATTDRCSLFNEAPARNYFTTGTATLSWTRVSWATGYELQIDTDINFAAPYTLYETNLTAGTLEYEIPLSDGVYFWRVRAKTAGTPGTWSTPERFEMASE